MSRFTVRLPASPSKRSGMVVAALGVMVALGALYGDGAQQVHARLHATGFDVRKHGGSSRAAVERRAPADATARPGTRHSMNGQQPRRFEMSSQLCCEFSCCLVACGQISTCGHRRDDAARLRSV